MPSVCLKYQVLVLIYSPQHFCLQKKMQVLGRTSTSKLVTVPIAIPLVSSIVWGLETLCDVYSFLYIMHYPLPILNKQMLF